MDVQTHAEIELHAKSYHEVEAKQNSNMLYQCCCCDLNKNSIEMDQRDSNAAPSRKPGRHKRLEASVPILYLDVLS